MCYLWAPLDETLLIHKVVTILGRKWRSCLPYVRLWKNPPGLPSLVSRQTPHSWRLLWLREYDILQFCSTHRIHTLVNGEQIGWLTTWSHYSSYSSWPRSFLQIGWATFDWKGLFYLSAKVLWNDTGPAISQNKDSLRSTKEHFT